MSDDIVTRLREALRHEDGYQMTMAPELVSAIADEIERLRAFADDLMEAAEVDRKNLMLRILALELAYRNE